MRLTYIPSPHPPRPSLPGLVRTPGDWSGRTLVGNSPSLYSPTATPRKPQEASGSPSSCFTPPCKTRRLNTLHPQSIVLKTMSVPVQPSVDISLTSSHKRRIIAEEKHQDFGHFFGGAHPTHQCSSTKKVRVKQAFCLTISEYLRVYRPARLGQIIQTLGIRLLILR